jgi:V/A-type H+-transporting ATPase subunit D
VLQTTAAATLTAALARHGLHELQVYPPAPATRRVRIESRSLLGVTTSQSHLIGTAGEAAPAVFPSPEAEACRTAYAQTIAKLVELAAVSASLARLYSEYRRTVRRVRALQDMLLPELDTEIADIGTRLEDLEREEAVALRFRL